jgi:S1-C subfamily serine protease
MATLQSRRTPFLPVIVWLTLSLAVVQSARADSQTIYNRLLRSTGWINCLQPDGSNSWGTCWLADQDERLVVTNKHVVDHAARVVVDFPMFKDGKLVTKVSEYLKTSPINGKLLALDGKRDLALCQLESLPAGIVALPLARTSAARGNRVFALGNSGANTPIPEERSLWRTASGKVDFRYFDVVTFQKPPKQKVEANVIRATLPTAGGDSGGPVVNTGCELVAVHSNGDKFHSFSIDVAEVRTFIERALQSRRLPHQEHDVVGTWTVATTDELGRCYWSLTVRANGSCLMERDQSFEGTFACSDRADMVRLSIPGMALKGDVAIAWANDDQFSFTCNGKDFTAVRR